MFWHRVIDTVAPPRCVFCAVTTRRAEGGICAGCEDDLPRVASPPSWNGPELAQIIVPLAYEFPVDAAIRAFKFRRRLYYAPAFTRLLRRASPRLAQDIDALVPVPLHWRRQWWRGFNQAREIAGPLARELGIPLVQNVVRRRATRPQSGLTAAERRRNLRGAFEVRGRLPYRHVLIVDDVITTGTTVMRLAAALHHAGADRVSAIAVAKA